MSSTPLSFARELLQTDSVRQDARQGKTDFSGAENELLFFLLRCYDHLRFSTFSLFFNIRYLRISRSSIFVFSISLYLSKFLCLSLLIYVCLFPFFNLTSCRQRCFNCFHISSFSTTILPCLSLSLTSQVQAKLLQFSGDNCLVSSVGEDT